MSAPGVAVIGLPGLPRALADAGYSVLAGGATDAATVASALRSPDGPYVVVVAGDDPALRQWVSLQLNRGVAVLVASSPELAFGDVPPGCRTIELPADVDTIMGRFGAPGRGAPAGLVVIDAGGEAPPVVVPPPSPFELATGPDAQSPAPTDGAALVADLGGLPPPPPRVAPAGGGVPWQPAAVPAMAVAERAPDPAPPVELRPPVPTERGWVAPVQRSPVIPESMDPAQMFRPVTVSAEPARAVRRAPVIITFSGKGGVGKTATAIAVAQRAVTIGGMKRVLLVDANRGQGDVRAYVRVARGVSLPSLFDAATANDPRRAIVGPTELNKARGDALAPLGFGVALAPDDAHAAADAVPTGAYRDVVDYARERFDLVVLDTQIVEASDTSGLIDGLVVPLLLDGAFGLAITDSSMAGVRNIFARLNMLISRGVTRDHLLLAVNRASPDSGLDEGLMRKNSELLATWAGLVVNDPAVGTAFEQGHVPGSAGAPPTPAYTAMLDVVLRRVTGLAAFDVSAGGQPRRGGLFRHRR